MFESAEELLQNTHDQAPLRHNEHEHLGARPQNLFIYFLNPPGGSKVQASQIHLSVVMKRMEAGGKASGLGQARQGAQVWAGEDGREELRTGSPAPTHGGLLMWPGPVKKEHGLLHAELVEKQALHRQFPQGQRPSGEEGHRLSQPKP